MTSNVSARAATAGELIKYRDVGHWVKPGLAIQHPDTVFRARVNDAFADGLDGVVQFGFDTVGYGAYTDVKQNMMAWIGSTLGGHERGIIRVRQEPTSSVFYCNPFSDIPIADNDYIEVFNAYSIWPRDYVVDGRTIYVDNDILFGDYRNGGIIPRVGPLASVVRLTGATVDFTPPDPSLSAGYDGTTIVSWEYFAPGASATSGMTGTTPVFTYDTAGEYEWSIDILDSNGRTTTAHRWIFVEPDEMKFEIESCSGDYSTGYWSFTVTLFDSVAMTTVHDRALAVLYEDKAFYNNTAGSIGKMTGYENITCVGWNQ